MKRIALFLMTNLAVILVLGIVLNLIFAFTGVDTRSVGGLLVLAAVFGFGGSFISLAISKWMAKRSTGAVVIEHPSNEMERWLVNTINVQSQKVGITAPEVAIFNAPESNAFATGMNKNKALVAVSSGLLDTMTRDEAEAVLAHEISHIANGDMVTLSLIQGVVNTFVIFIARLLGGVIDNALSNNNDESSGHGFSYFIIVFLLEMVFGVLASTIVMYFSRQREFSADAGAAELVGKDKMIAALRRLQKGSEPHLEGSLMAFGISGKRSGGLFMSHPPLEKRIEALQNGKRF
ncbi:protease HtpX [Psychromonas antarctica]|jgi:heat shock protein HtpX|uniref:protease HtpX n=1 Tax=Psychromonas antarctica TaxID=67573 RepID=UPI001EE7E4AC|nr:protease HtpX [Psychromonas antarctica]MCG6201566.1 protease HtpX [Psychromonas antarctica]